MRPPLTPQDFGRNGSLSKFKKNDSTGHLLCRSSCQPIYVWSNSDTPMGLKVKYGKNNREPVSDPIIYRTLVDYHTYLKMTPPDIFYVVQPVIQSLSNPCHVHRNVLRIIQYLQRSSRCVILFFKGSSMQLTTYDDIDWAGSPDTCQSRTSWCVFLENSPISWKYKKQDIASPVLYRSWIVFCMLQNHLVSIFTCIT